MQAVSLHVHVVTQTCKHLGREGHASVHVARMYSHCPFFGTKGKRVTSFLRDCSKRCKGRLAPHSLEDVVGAAPRKRFHKRFVGARIQVDLPLRAAREHVVDKLPFSAERGGGGGGGVGAEETWASQTYPKNRRQVELRNHVRKEDREVSYQTRPDIPTQESLKRMRPTKRNKRQARQRRKQPRKTTRGREQRDSLQETQTHRNKEERLL